MLTKELMSIMYGDKHAGQDEKVTDGTRNKQFYYIAQLFKYPD